VPSRVKDKPKNTIRRASAQTTANTIASEPKLLYSVIHSQGAGDSSVSNDLATG
jgi:hypothetical protein